MQPMGHPQHNPTRRGMHSQRPEPQHQVQLLAGTNGYPTHIGQFLSQRGIAMGTLVVGEEEEDNTFSSSSLLLLPCNEVRIDAGQRHHDPQAPQRMVSDITMEWERVIIAMGNTPVIEQEESSPSSLLPCNEVRIDVATGQRMVSDITTPWARGVAMGDTTPVVLEVEEESSPSSSLLLPCHEVRIYAAGQRMVSAITMSWELRPQEEDDDDDDKDNDDLYGWGGRFSEDDYIDDEQLGVFIAGMTEYPRRMASETGRSIMSWEMRALLQEVDDKDNDDLNVSGCRFSEDDYIDDDDQLGVFIAEL
jgi:hypothetical protein